MNWRLLTALVLLLALAVAAPAGAEVIQGGGVRVRVSAAIEPQALPRRGTAPVDVSFSSSLSPIDGFGLPQLERVSIAINAHGRLRLGAAPQCRLEEIVASTDDGALAACHRSLVGEGRMRANVSLPEQAPIPSTGRLLAFDGSYEGAPAILAHVYGLQPFASTYVLPFSISHGSGAFGTVLSAYLAPSTGAFGYVTDISMTLGNRFGAVPRFLVAGCPAPAGTAQVLFPLAKATFTFVGGLKLSSILNRTCRVAGAG